MSADNGSTETTYNYDANGNRNGGSYDVGSGNRLSTDGVWNYSYDNEGNLIKRVNITEGEDAGVTWTYAYDHANHLIQAKEWSEDLDENPETATLLLQVNYTYDVFGNRIEKSVDWDGAGENDPVVSKFAYDGWNNVKSSSPVGNENWDVIADLDDAGSLITRYTRGDAVDQLFARIANDGDTLWNLTDQLGSVRDVIDNTGAVLDSISYDGFGRITESDPEFGGRYKWTSREFDAETGLQFNRARYYDAETGRWITQDPLGFDAGDSNLYRYVNNRPTMEVDPSGKVPLPNGDDLSAKFTDTKFTGLYTAKGKNKMKEVYWVQFFKASVYAVFPAGAKQQKVNHTIIFPDNRANVDLSKPGVTYLDSLKTDKVPYGSNPTVDTPNLGQKTVNTLFNIYNKFRSKELKGLLAFQLKFEFVSLPVFVDKATKELEVLGEVYWEAYTGFFWQNTKKAFDELHYDNDAVLNQDTHVREGSKSGPLTFGTALSLNTYNNAMNVFFKGYTLVTNPPFPDSNG